jgi:hypothetical protein
VLTTVFFVTILAPEVTIAFARFWAFVAPKTQ